MLGPLKMPNVIPRMSETPGKIEHAGPDLGNANEQVYERELGLSKERVAAQAPLYQHPYRNSLNSGWDLAIGRMAAERGCRGQ